MKIDDTLIIRNRVIKNRIVMPAMICNNWGDNNGFQTVDRSEHYGIRAKGGVGLIVTEASAVSKDSKIEETALGIWKDEHIDQFRGISDICHKYETVVLIQIAHSGYKSCNDFSSAEVEKIKDDFINAAVRAEKAGMDGVEIHGAHGFLLNQFTSSISNKRDDQYGGSLSNRLKLSLEILKEIRDKTGKNFIISYRLGVNDLNFAEDKVLARRLEEAGVDILSVSYGIGVDDLTPPETFPLSGITYMGTVIKEAVSVPVISVNDIREPSDAKYLLKSNLTDFAAVGRGLLADPEWTNKAINCVDVDKCFHCKSWCKYGKDGRKCPRNVIRKNS